VKTQDKKKFLLKIYSSTGALVLTKTIGGKRLALKEAINLSKKPITDKVHLLGIKERTSSDASIGDLWDCLELIQGIFQDWNVERPELLYPILVHQKENSSGSQKTNKRNKRKNKK